MKEEPFKLTVEVESELTLIKFGRYLLVIRLIVDQFFKLNILLGEYQGVSSVTYKLTPTFKHILKLLFQPFCFGLNFECSFYKFLCLFSFD